MTSASSCCAYRIEDRAKVIPLAPAAAQVIEAQRGRREAGNPYVFPGGAAGKQLSDLEKPWSVSARWPGFRTFESTICATRLRVMASWVAYLCRCSARCWVTVAAPQHNDMRILEPILCGRRRRWSTAAGGPLDALGNTKCRGAEAARRPHTTAEIFAPPHVKDVALTRLKDAHARYQRGEINGREEAGVALLVVRAIAAMALGIESTDPLLVPLNALTTH